MAPLTLDTIYGHDATMQILRALRIPEHPPPEVSVVDGYPPRVHVSWQNGAHMTMRPVPGVVHFQELCSAVGRERPTGLYTALCEQLPPVLKSLGVHVLTCEPATQFAADRLATRGAWQGIRRIEAQDYWLWWIGDWMLEAQRMADVLVKTVRAERGA